MKANTLVSAAASLAAFVAPVHAYWRMPCPGRLMSERADPVVDPGKIAGHVHQIAGGNGFNLTMDYADTQASECSSCPIQQDLSNYWTPTLYYMEKNGTYTAVPQAGDGDGVLGGMTVYYLQRGGPNNDNLTAFPEGFRMLAGTSTLRTGGDSYEQQAVSFVCLNYSGTSPYYNGMPDQVCPDGLRAQIFFPACWDGVNLDSSDHKSHMAYPTADAYDNGPCPASHPVHLISLFFETIWSTADFEWYEPENGYQPFVWSMGDPTGYGYHGDFVNGWNVTALQNATDNCMADTGYITDCDVFTFYTDDECNACILAPTIDETIDGNLEFLPGCNEVTYDNYTVPMSNCTSSASIGAAKSYASTESNWTYVGCGIDDSVNRTFTADQWWSDEVDIPGCLDYCGNLGYTLAALEYGSQCYCGDTIAADRAPVTGVLGNCLSPCAGNSSQYCGGSNRLSIYNMTGTFTELSSADKTISCPNSNGTTYESTNGTFTIECGIDHSGGDLSMVYVTAGNITGCMVACAELDDCSFVSLSGSACYMKGGPITAAVADSLVYGAYISTPSNKTTTTTSNNSTTSASSSTSVSASTTSSVVQYTSTAAPKCTGSNSTYYEATTGDIFLIQCGIDHSGGDLTSTSTSTFQECIEACASTSGCVDVSLSGSACYMKSTVGAPVYSNSGIYGAKWVSSGSSANTSSTVTSTSTGSATSTSASGTATVTAATCPANNGDIYVDPTSGSSFLLECGIDHSGGDLSMTYVSSFAKCISTCANTTGCVDVSLSGTACYLKSSVGASITDSGILGAKLIAAASTSSSASSSAYSTLSSASSTVSASSSAYSTLSSASSTVSSSSSAYSTLSSASSTVSSSSSASSANSTASASSSSTASSSISSSSSVVSSTVTSSASAQSTSSFSSVSSSSAVPSNSTVSSYSTASSSSSKVSSAASSSRSSSLSSSTTFATMTVASSSSSTAASTASDSSDVTVTATTVTTVLAGSSSSATSSSTASESDVTITATVVTTVTPTASFTMSSSTSTSTSS